MADVPTVSVLLPVRDGNNVIASAMRSILEQSFPDFELLVLDDGSSDGTSDVVWRLADERVRVFSDGARRGLAARLNQGIDLARGRYLARMDADDLSFSDRLEKQVQYLDKHLEVDLVAARAIVFRDATMKLIGMFPYRQHHEAIVAEPWRGFYLPHPSWMGRAQWFRRFRYRFPEAIRAEDQELLLRAMPHSRYYSLPDVLLAYRQGPFKYRNTLTARRSLLAAQSRLFIERGEYADLIRALVVSAIKVIADSVAAIPGCERAYFSRMGEPIAEEVQAAFAELLKRCCRDSDTGRDNPAPATPRNRDHDESTG